MNKILFPLFLALAASIKAGAQGTVTFLASGSSRPIAYSSDGLTSTKVPAGSTVPGGGTLYIAIYGNATPGQAISLDGPGLGPNLTGWVASTPLISSITPVAGQVPSTKVTFDPSLGPPGATLQMEVVAWTSVGNAYSTFTQAEAAWEAGAPGVAITWSGDTAVFGDGGLGWTITTGTSTSPAAMPTGAAAFNGLVLILTPEPAIPILMGMGGVALLLFRRLRKTGGTL